MVAFDSVGRADHDAQNFVSIGPPVPKLSQFEVVVYLPVGGVTSNEKFSPDRAIGSRLGISDGHPHAEHDAANREQIGPAVFNISRCVACHVTKQSS